MRNRIVLLCLFLVAFMVLSQQGRRVAAHASYDRSEPSADAVLPSAPDIVRIWFTEELFRRQGVNGIEVYNATGTRVDLDDAMIDDDDRSLMAVSLPPALPADRYTVRWQTLSADDGHEGSGEFSFTVNGGAVTEPTVATAVEPVSTATMSAIASTPDASTPDVPTPTNVPEPTATPASPATGLPCLGGAAPLLLFAGIASGWQRRKQTRVRP